MGILGTTEIIIILAVALIAFGPHRLPELARYAAKAMKMFKEASRELQNQLNIDDWDLDKPTKSYHTSNSSSNSNQIDYDSPDDYEYNSPYGDEDDGYYGDDVEGEISNSDSSSDHSSDFQVIDDPAKDQDAKREARELDEV